jgi:hypothetical protein
MADCLLSAHCRLSTDRQRRLPSVWFSEHHFRPVWSHNSAPHLTLAAVSRGASTMRLGVGVVLAPIHHPLHIAQRMATLDILSHGREDVGLDRTGYPYPSGRRSTRRCSTHFGFSTNTSSHISGPRSRVLRWHELCR